MARGFIEDDKTKLAWNLPRVLLPKNRVKLLLNMLVIAGQTIPRGGTLTVDPVGEGETMGFRITATGINARIPQAMPGLLAGQSESGTVDAHAIQPFYTGLLARACGLAVDLAAEGDTVIGRRPAESTRSRKRCARELLTRCLTRGVLTVARAACVMQPKLNPLPTH